MARAVRGRTEPFEPASRSAARWRYAKKKRFRPSEQFRPDVSKKRDAFWETIAKVPFENLIFIDESGCNIAMTPSYGRAPRGQRVLDHKPANWGENLSVVGAIRADRVLAHQTFEGAVNGPRFVQFVRRRLIRRLYPGDVVVLDNLRAHYAPAVRELIESVGARLVFLPPYSPDFSPIEPCWSFIKQWLRSLKERVPERLKSAIVRAFQRVTPRHLTAWFHHCGYQFNRSSV